ncbi:MAG: ATP-binding cassette domain-containing protein [Pseudomonadales bacterium]|jgi:oligopeptide/dipeptide ABC transporter ATP-binding protein|nr:ATP-binding cassette domain-containing protein [Gammaproteobacteria bacterium]MBP6051451.1 ATP-binding cassette domain-containing protein [Pseudomonadales bacterium]MBK7171268.1 ATP-binding cassette domain-containing protein [Gammaproteobacteria bacterium]MBK7518906.1 ATP-binding cassette domain-containing protein [Gammaproteobacteria bacterium]MBK8307120.1 ATP-binding cassette domain-containing protein [Gammaproteobacteria bacterium]
MSVLLDIRDLKTHFRLGPRQTVHAVDGITLAIERNQIVGLVGESGSGKSTLGKTVAGLLPRTSGEIRYDGKPLPQRYSVADFRRYSREIQMIFQDPYASLNPRMTVEEIIGEGLRLQPGATPRDHRAQVAQWLERVGLSADHMMRYPHEFSGGQRQRLGIARALIVKPKFVVCDEPISALDVSVQAQIVNLLGELQATLGLTLLFIAHDLSMVRYISDRMVVMYLGALVEEGPADQVYFEPRHPYTRLLVASNPEPDPRIEKARVHEPIVGDIPSPINVPAGCRFAGRCPDVMARCRIETPGYRSREAGRMIACHLYD